MALKNILLVPCIFLPFFQFSEIKENELDLDLLISKAKDEVLRLRKEETRLSESGLSGRRLRGRRSTERALALGNSSLLYEIVTKQIYTAGRKQRWRRSLVELNDLVVDSPGEVECDARSRYRTHSGLCNNLQRREEGASHSLQERILPSSYQDGVSQPRHLSVTGEALPSARLVSNRLHQDTDITDQYSLMLMQWGQFLDHDLTHVPSSVPSCAGCEETPAGCYPIPVPGADDHFQGIGAPQCLPFSRSVGGQQHLGPRQQLNALTSYIDGSMVYGSDERKNKLLRDGHLLRHSSQAGESPLLPLATDIPDCAATSGHCFLAGDVRANEQPGLTALHTVMLRLHNNIASDLDLLNPHWSKETVYQETRRIIVAIIQHITYSEFLPRVLGPYTMQRFSLELEEFGHHHYDPSCSAAIYNEFSAAAFRFGHSMIQPALHLMTEDEMVGGHRGLGGRYHKLLLREHFHNPDFILSNNHAVEKIIRGLVSMPMSGVDSKFTSSVTNHLFEERKKKFSGFDLVALNIQRGRDHGLAGYNQYRELCGLPRLETFNTSDAALTPEILEQMATIYLDPDDVDLFTGLMSEERLENSLVGPTLACLLALQFKNLRRCDRFWYETGDEHLRFSPDQLAEIRSVSLAGVLCSSGEDIRRIQRSSFDLPDMEANRLRTCGELSRNIDLRYWKESNEEQCQVDGSNPVSPCDSCHCEEPRSRYCRASCTELIKTFGFLTVKEDVQCQERCHIV